MTIPNVDPTKTPLVTMLQSVLAHPLAGPVRYLILLAVGVAVHWGLIDETVVNDEAVLVATAVIVILWSQWKEIVRLRRQATATTMAVTETVLRQAPIQTPLDASKVQEIIAQAGKAVRVNEVEATAALNRMQAEIARRASGG